jgi:hypothetical protein
MKENSNIPEKSFSISKSTQHEEMVLKIFFGYSSTAIEAKHLVLPKIWRIFEEECMKLSNENFTRKGKYQINFISFNGETEKIRKHLLNEGLIETQEEVWED